MTLIGSFRSGFWVPAWLQEHFDRESYPSLWERICTGYSGFFGKRLGYLVRVSKRPRKGSTHRTGYFDAERSAWELICR